MTKTGNSSIPNPALDRHGVVSSVQRSTRTAATLNSGIFEVGSSARLVSWFAAFVAGPVVRDEDRVGPDRGHHVGRQANRTATRGDGDTVTVGDAESLRELGVDLAQRLGVLVDQRGDAPGLGAGEVLADDPTGGEPDWVLVVDDFGRSGDTGRRGTWPCRRDGRTCRPRTAAACRDGRPRGSARTAPSHPRCAARWHRRSSPPCRQPTPAGAPRRSASVVVVVGSSDPRRGGQRGRCRISQSTRASPGGSTALLIFTIRPSPVVDVPSSSSCSEPGSTMSACCADSERKKSITE